MPERFNKKDEYHSIDKVIILLLMTGLASLFLFTAYAGSPNVVDSTPPTITVFGRLTYTLSFQAYDYNSKGEVSILVNNQVVATLPKSNAPKNHNQFTSFSLDISKYVVSGGNTVIFKQNLDSSGVKSVQVIGANGLVVYSNSTYYTLPDGGRQSVTYKFNISAAGNLVSYSVKSPDPALNSPEKLDHNVAKDETRDVDAAQLLGGQDEGRRASTVRQTRR